MSAFTVEKFFCAVPLRWGALIIGIVDIILGIVAYILSEGVNDAALDIIMIVCYFVHMVGCVLLIISVFVSKHQLVICYLITGMMRLLLITVLIIVEAINGYDFIAMYIIEIVILGNYLYSIPSHIYNFNRPQDLAFTFGSVFILGMSVLGAICAASLNYI